MKSDYKNEITVTRNEKEEDAKTNNTHMRNIIIAYSCNDPEI